MHQAVKQAIERTFPISRVDGHWHVDSDWLGLAEPMNPVVALLLDRWVPPARQVNYVRRGRQCEARAGGLWTEHKKVEDRLTG